MEIAKMNYYFTGILIVLMCVLALFVKPAHSRNEYLNDGTNSCSTGSFDISVQQRDSENRYRHNNPDNNYNSPSDDQSISLTWRKYLGSACTDEFKKVQQENMELKQQLELLKHCNKVNNNPTLQYNENFRLLVSKCRNVKGSDITRPNDDGSYWDVLKDDYKKENPEINLMGDSKLLISPKNFKLPEPKSEEEAWNEIE
jgi:hypothetical protein